MLKSLQIEIDNDIIICNNSASAGGVFYIEYATELNISAKNFIAT